MDALIRNLRYAIRVLSRTPAFTATVVATLAIVIGANAAVFSLIDAVLLKPLPFPEPDRLVLLSEAREGAPISNTAPVRIEEWNAATTTLAAFLGKALGVVALACTAGVALSLALSEVLDGLLYGVSSADPLALAAVILLVTGVGTVAALVPALRAARVDPMNVLREE